MNISCLSLTCSILIFVKKQAV